MNRKLQIGIGISIILLFIIFLSVNLFNTNFDKEKPLNALKSAIDNKDIEYMKSHLKVKGKSSLTNDEVIKITDLLNEKGSNNIKYYDRLGNHTDNIYITKSGKEKFMYDKFIVNVDTINFMLYTNVEGAEVYLDDKSVGKTDKDHIILVKNTIPGEYNVKVKYKGKYADNEKSEKIKIYNGLSREIEKSIELDIDYIEINSNRNDAKLYVNNKDTGLLIEDIDKFGPVNLDGSISIQAKLKTDKGTLESEMLTVEDGISYNLLIEEEPEQLTLDKNNTVNTNVYEDENIMSRLAELVYNYEVGLVNAINYDDFNYASPYILRGSKLDSMQRNLVKELNKKNIKEDFLNFEILDAKAISNDEYQLKVVESHKLYKSNGSEEDVKNTWRYTVKRIGDTYYLTNLQSI